MQQNNRFEIRVAGFGGQNILQIPLHFFASYGWNGSTLVEPFFIDRLGKSQYKLKVYSRVEILRSGALFPGPGYI